MCDDSWWLGTSTLFCVKNDFDHNKSFVLLFFQLAVLLFVVMVCNCVAPLKLAALSLSQIRLLHFDEISDIGFPLLVGATPAQ